MMSTALKSNTYDNQSEQDIIFIRNVAARIHRSGMITPAVFFLELPNPLAVSYTHLTLPTNREV